MLGKLISKAVELGKGRAAAPVMAAPDISRVIRMTAGPQVAAPQVEEFVADEPEAADPMLMVSHAEGAVDALSGEFEGWMRADLDKLREAWVAAQGPDANADDYRALYTSAHNIRGAATSYGYPAVSRLCGSLCALLGQTPPGENAALINLHVEACRAAVAAGPQGEGSESVADAVCEALESKVHEKLATAI